MGFARVTSSVRAEPRDNGGVKLVPCRWMDGRGCPPAGGGAMVDGLNLTRGPPWLVRSLWRWTWLVSDRGLQPVMMSIPR